jgi:MtrB/PioB family decaheme-associated outer membrane protein
MKNWTLLPGATRALIALAAGAAFTLAHAQDGGGIAPLTTAPESSVSVGAGFASGNQQDRARFGMFNGLRKDDTNGLLGFGYYNRDAATGKWLSIEGRNLGLDNREFGVSYRWLGDMKVNVDYSELVRHDPRTINTSLTGAGTTNPTVSLLTTPGTGQDLNLELKRKSIGLVLEKQFGNFQVEVNFKNEDKNGARFFGRGFACSTTYDRGAGTCSSSTTPTTLLMLPEPVDSTIRQLDAKLNYNGEKLKLSGGYYGNFYTNNNGSFAPTILGANMGNLNGGVQAWDANLRNFMQGPIALWPDSQAHQLFIGGNYAMTPSTKINFKYAYTHATQHESFSGMGLTGAPAGRDNLGGVLNTTKFQLGFSSHPVDKLQLRGGISYVGKENKTPIDIYNRQVLANAVAPGAVTYSTWSNSAMSPNKFEAKLEADYRLPYSLLLVGGVKYDRENTGAWTPTDAAGGISALRQIMATSSSRIELKKTMSETFTGSLAFVDERRTGESSWLKPTSAPLTGVFAASGDCASVGANACVFSATAQIPYTMKDMQRQKVRATGNWSPMDRLSLQAFVETGRDDYRGPTTTSGLFHSQMYNATFDASYELSENWKVNGYLTRGQQQLQMGHSADYDGRVKDTSSTFGLGFTGTPFARFRVGGDLISLHDTLAYVITPDVQISAANRTLLGQTGGLPDVKYKLFRVKLYGEYAVNKASTVRLDYIYNRTFFNEWTYGNNGVPFLYSDNTTLSAKQLQSVNFIGASYIHKFQ